MRELPGVGAPAANRATAEGMLAVAAMLLLGESAVLAHPADADSVDRMITCLQARGPLYLRLSERLRDLPECFAFVYVPAAVRHGVAAMLDTSA